MNKGVETMKTKKEILKQIEYDKKALETNTLEGNTIRNLRGWRIAVLTWVVTGEYPKEVDI